jgi:ribosomal protein S18 acetylase RimI-like enzyme
VPPDAPAIAAVFGAAVRDSWSFLGARVQRPMFPEHYWDRLIADHEPPNALIVAADQTKRVLGFTGIHAADGEMFLLFVDPAHQGRGVGRTLLDTAHALLREAGYREAFLFTEERNVRALTVYEAAGYRHDGTARESDFEGVPLRELRLVKGLV